MTTPRTEADFSAIWEGVRNKIDMEQVQQAGGRKDQLNEFKRQLEERNDQLRNLAGLAANNLKQVMYMGLAEITPFEKLKRTELGRKARKAKTEEQVIERISDAFEKKGFETKFVEEKKKGRGRKTTITRTNWRKVRKGYEGITKEGKKTKAIPRIDNGNLLLFVEGVRGIVGYIKKADFNK